MHLKSAEIALESFKVNTITQPSEGTPVSAGVEEVPRSRLRQLLQPEGAARESSATAKHWSGSSPTRAADRSLAKRSISIPNVVAGAQGCGRHSRSCPRRKRSFGRPAGLDRRAQRRERASEQYRDTPSTDVAGLDHGAPRGLRRREAELGRRIESASREPVHSDAHDRGDALAARGRRRRGALFLAADALRRGAAG